MRATERCFFSGLQIQLHNNWPDFALLEYQVFSLDTNSNLNAIFYIRTEVGNEKMISFEANSSYNIISVSESLELLPI